MIKDSGERREFETGAVRDIQKGKGRCDLMPLDVASFLLSNVPYKTRDTVLAEISAFVFNGKTIHLERALNTHSRMLRICFLKYLFILKKAPISMVK